MKTTRVSVILVLAIGAIASGSQYLTVNDQQIDSIVLKVGQTCTVRVVSDDASPYDAYVGFDDGVVLGYFTHVQTMAGAGDLADIREYDVPAFYGYYVEAAGASPPPSAGVHFVLEYEPQQLGQTDLKLRDYTFAPVIDSVHITVVSAEMGTDFTYQGKLIDNNSAADGPYDFRFGLYDAPSNGSQFTDTIEINEVDVIDGYFMVDLDFGASAFDGNNVWLEIDVRPTELDEPKTYTTLRPRQEISAAPYALQTRGIFVDDAGKVGMGTTSPASRLDVDGDINTSSVYRIRGYTFLSSPVEISNTLAGILAGSDITTGTSNSAFGFRALDEIQGGSYNTAVGASALQSNKGGSRNIAVGSQALSQDTGGSYNIAMGHRALNNHIEGDNNVAIGTSAGHFCYGGNNVFLGHEAGRNEAGSNTLYIANSDANTLIYGEFDTGNVGIGTTDPDSRLHVVASDSDYGLYVESAREEGKAIRAAITASEGTAVSGRASGSESTGVQGTATEYGVSGTNNSSNNWGYLGGTSAAVFGMAFSGYAGYFDGEVHVSRNLGIGTTSAQAKLDVDGKVRIRDFYTSGGSYDVQVQDDGDLVKATSSRRYKRDIKDLETDSEDVLGLRPVTFRWKETGRQDVGLVAEETAEAMPDLVVYDSEGRPDAVKYDKVALYLLAVVKELKAENEVLRNKLRSENISLKQRLETIEKAIQQKHISVLKEVR